MRMTVAWTLPSMGTTGSRNGTLERIFPNSSRARRMSGEWLATLTVSWTARRAPTVLLISRAKTRAGMTPERTIWPGAFALAHQISPCSRACVDDVMDLLVGEADDRAHAAVDAALLHDPTALADEAQGRLEVDGVGRHGRRVLSGGVAGDLERREDDAAPRRVGPHRLEVGDAGRQDRGLGVDGAVELLRRSLEDEPGEREPQLASARSSTSAAAGERRTSSAPIPTYCDPWPGKTKA